MSIWPFVLLGVAFLLIVIPMILTWSKQIEGNLRGAQDDLKRASKHLEEASEILRRKP